MKQMKQLVKHLQEHFEIKNRRKEIMRTLNQAEKDCRAAWALRPDATHGWCIHHGREWEKLTEPIENRIDYILSYKAKTEQITRLDNMRPVSEASKTVVLSARKAHEEAVATAWKAYDEAVAPAWKAYEGAVATAGKAYDEVVAPAHKNDVPNHTWNGKDIF